ncbi:hypothetical protein DFH05DRAFT_1473442 [Lentinula detonsa]|uniref:Uncharacterized protein n=1 Tax=Lentinula detonsa TaxID=2804962 RepID=A0A9W8P7V3_9AGAR|nr:hypothetical protein DFH05DRAFT_1473442 [Lentinula detonsa]
MESQSRARFFVDTYKCPSFIYRVVLSHFLGGVPACSNLCRYKMPNTSTKKCSCISTRCSEEFSLALMMILIFYTLAWTY